MRRISSVREVSDIKLELPAGIEPYEEFDFEPYSDEARNEEELRVTWRVFTKVKDVLDNGRRLENISWRLWFKERQKGLPLSSFPFPPPPPTPANSLSAPYIANLLPSSGASSNKTIPAPTAPATNTSRDDCRDHGSKPQSTPMVPPSPRKAVIDEAPLSTLQQYGSNLDENLRRAEEETHRIVDDMFGGVGQRFQRESARLIQREKAERTHALLELGAKHDLSDVVLDDILKWVRRYVAQDDPTSHTSHVPPPIASATSSLPPAMSVPRSPSSPSLAVTSSLDHDHSGDFLPTSIADGRAFVERTRYSPRPHIGVFCHSLERNGANNFLLYLVRELRDDIYFEVVSAKEGNVRTEYEALGVSVSVCSMKSTTYREDVKKVMVRMKYAIANTIMMTEVVNAARELGISCLWVIHEAWPRHQFNYYAKDVFMTPHVDERRILEALRGAGRIVFPAKVQRRCYQGLFDESKCRVIYNGIPLASINAFRTTETRDAVRTELGLGSNDMVLLHMGSICRRKGQLLTCQVFADLYASEVRPLGRNLRLLLVGARYVRPHEIEYIEECQQTLEAADALESGAARIIDVTKNVLNYYLAADIVLCPSTDEMLPLVICEAMAFERPVIASKIDGIPEAVDDGVEGLLVEAGNEAHLYDAVMQLASDDELRARMGTAGRKRVLSQFSFETMSRTYRETIGMDLELDIGPAKSENVREAYT